MRIGILKFPGSTGDEVLMHVMRDLLEQNTQLIWHKNVQLENVDILIIPAGYAYGNYLRPGALAMNSPAIDSLREFSAKGRFVLGIANGFQLLCEIGLLPGALLPNAGGRFVCRNTHVKADNICTPVTLLLDRDKPVMIPVAHAAGRYHATTSELGDMRINGQILLRYCDEQGRITEAANPDGSIDNIAGVCDKAKNVYGIMPRFDLACDDEIGNTQGLCLFESILKTITA
jgi:phosphoribosylformylglycinamidine synthase subunit PurQ / glutaminase